MKSSKYNLSQKVVDVLTVYLILHYPLMKGLKADALVVRSLESAAVSGGASVAELLAGSAHLGACNTAQPKPNQAQAPPKEPNNESKIIEHQRRVIDQLVMHIKRQDERMDNLEAKVDGTPAQDKIKKHQHEPSQDEIKTKRRRASVANLHATWFAWYAQEPRGMADAPKRQRSNSKKLVAMMKLFIADDLKLDESAADYRDQVLKLGKKAEAAVLNFLASRNITSRGSTAIRKHLHELHLKGELNDKISHLQRLRRAAAILDPDRQEALEPVTSTTK